MTQQPPPASPAPWWAVLDVGLEAAILQKEKERRLRLPGSPSKGSLGEEPASGSCWKKRMDAGGEGKE